MNIYRIEMMTSKSYDIYMRGGYGYKVEYYDVEAESKEQALDIARKDNPDYHFNRNYVNKVRKREYTATQKDKMIEKIANLEKELEEMREGLKKLLERG